MLLFAALPHPFNNGCHRDSTTSGATLPSMAASLTLPFPSAQAAEKGPPPKRRHIAFLSEEEEEEEEEEDSTPTPVSLITQDGTQQVQRLGLSSGWSVVTNVGPTSASRTHSSSSGANILAFLIPLNREGWVLGLGCPVGAGLHLSFHLGALFC